MGGGSENLGPKEKSEQKLGPRLLFDPFQCLGSIVGVLGSAKNVFLDVEHHLSDREFDCYC